MGFLKFFVIQDSLKKNQSYLLYKQVSVISFGIFVFSSDENVLDAEKAFVSLSLFNSLRQPMTMLPMTVSNLIQVF